MRFASTFTADYNAYLAAQKLSQTDRSSMKGIENYELVSDKVSLSFTAAGPCNNPSFNFAGAGPCNNPPPKR